MEFEDMKIRGSAPYSGIFRSDKTSKSKKTKKSRYAEKSNAANEVATKGAVSAVDVVDSPYYDAMAQASKCLEETESIEEATHLVVSTVLEEQLGSKGLPSKEIEHITQVVTNSIANDESMKQRLESILRKLSSALSKSSPPKSAK